MSKEKKKRLYSFAGCKIQLRNRTPRDKEPVVGELFCIDHRGYSVVEIIPYSKEVVYRGELLSVELPNSEIINPQDYVRLNKPSMIGSIVFDGRDFYWEEFNKSLDDDILELLDQLLENDVS